MEDTFTQNSLDDDYRQVLLQTRNVLGIHFTYREGEH